MELENNTVWVINGNDCFAIFSSKEYAEDYKKSLIEIWEKSIVRDTVPPRLFKMDDSATAEDALAQINSKDYAIPYSTDHRKLVKVGVEFSQTERGVSRWLIN